LFIVSIVAVDAHTGKYRWHFQQVHHDIWDYDSHIQRVTNRSIR
jgi:glucose dehydrogenase